MPKITVSYRRSDSSATAGRIFDHLVSHFGEGSVFMDIDAIPFGTDFRTHIRAELLQSDILLAVIGPRWTGPGADGRSRIDDESDPVRVEVETALRNGITIVPVVIDGARMPTVEDLPEAVRDLAFVNAAPVDMGRDFRAHMERLTRSLDIIVARKAAETPAAAPVPPLPTLATPGSWAGRRAALAGVAGICVVALVGAAGWREWGGRTDAKAASPPPVAPASSPTPAPATSTTGDPPATVQPAAQGEPKGKAEARGASHGTFAWYELWTTNAVAAQGFYRSVIGWDTRTAGYGDAAYTTLLAGSVPVAGLATLPAGTVAQGARPSWVGYVTVGDVDASAAEAKALGGTIYRAPADVPGIGRYALVADPQGALIVLFKGLVDPPRPPSPAPAGHAGWRELQASDRDAAFAFYARMFGWTKAEAGDVTFPGRQLFAAGANPIGAIGPKPAGAPVPYWTYYFQVDGLAAAAARVQAGGGTVVNPPEEIQGGRWIVQCLDPQGAPFALMSVRR